MHGIPWHLHTIQKSGLLKSGESNFSLVWVMELLVKENFFLKTLTCQTQLTFSVSMKMVNKLSVSDGVYTLFKKAFLLFDTALLKCFVYSRVGILDYPWCNNPCCSYQELGQGNSYSFDQKRIYYLTTKNVAARKTVLTSILSITFVIEWTSAGL